MKYRKSEIHLFRVSKELQEAHAHQVWSQSEHYKVCTDYENLKTTIFLTYGGRSEHVAYRVTETRTGY